MDHKRKESPLSKVANALDNPGSLLPAAEGREFPFDVRNEDTDLVENVRARVIDGQVRVTGYAVATISGGALPDTYVRAEVQKGVGYLVEAKLLDELVGPNPGATDIRTLFDYFQALAVRDEAAHAVAAHSEKVRRRNDWTPARLKELADVYRQAQEDGVPPRQACAQHFHLAPTTISRAIRLAREAGYLAPPEGK